MIKENKGCLCEEFGKNLKKVKLGLHGVLLCPTLGDFFAATNKVKLKPKLEELLLLSLEIDNVFLSSSDTKAANTAFASLKH